MKKLSVLLVVLAACHNAGPSTPTVGAASPEAALTAFMAGAKAQDLQAIANVWGNSKGLVRNSVDRGELEKRELIIIKLLCQDQYRVASKTQGLGGTQVLQVEMKKGAKVGNIKFTTVRGVADRWYVEDIDTVGLMEFCKPT